MATLAFDYCGNYFHRNSDTKAPPPYHYVSGLSRWCKSSLWADILQLISEGHQELKKVLMVDASNEQAHQDTTRFVARIFLIVGHVPTPDQCGVEFFHRDSRRCFTCTCARIRSQQWLGRSRGLLYRHVGAPILSALVSRLLSFLISCFLFCLPWTLHRSM